MQSRLLWPPPIRSLRLTLLICISLVGSSLLILSSWQ
jgi:hypothetical protein